MKLRYRAHPEHEFEASQFNTHSLCEVLTGDDSAYMSELDCFVKATGEWKPLATAMRDKDVITDNYDTCFFEPQCAADRERGYTLS